jgi:cadherin EGF LAG seven-pass G-type receptor 1
LLYNGRYNERHDFIALELIDGRLQFSFSLGANLSHVLLEHPHSLADGDWHTVTIDYFNRVSPFEKCHPLGICPTKGENKVRK